MKIAIIGNSGSGKSTLAAKLAARGAAAVLDLDLVFWEPGSLVEKPPGQRAEEVRQFCRGHESWIVEGCYADLIEVALEFGPELIFMDPGLEVCQANCRSRPHEPHKFESKEEQDRRLGFLLEWVADYYNRDGLMSRRAHKELFDRYIGPKQHIRRQ